MDYINIGNVKIKKTAALAPMASVADRAYRLMCKKYGAAYVVGEMASSKGLCYSDKKTPELLEVTGEEEPMAVQLFGDDPEFMAKASLIAEKYSPQIIDINMGCPVPKVAGNGSGSALMQKPQVAEQIVKAMVNATKIPITVKIRKGWDEQNINAVDFAKRMEQAGASAIAVHGRTKKQMYSGKSDIEIIKAVKEAVSVPVIGNGDIVTPMDAKYMYDYTGCDLVMIGRGTYGRPYVFEQIEAYLKDGTIIPEKTTEERLDIMWEHINLICKFKGEYGGIREARKHVAWYLKGLKNAASYRSESGSLQSLEELWLLIEKIKHNLQD